MDSLDAPVLQGAYDVLPVVRIDIDDREFRIGIKRHRQDERAIVQLPRLRMAEVVGEESAGLDVYDFKTAERASVGRRVCLVLEAKKKGDISPNSDSTDTRRDGSTH